jgi:FMN phosphatase YigB (HAD superfamily)
MSSLAALRITPLGPGHKKYGEVRDMNGKQRSPLVFLLDVDNTLLDNDRAKADIQAEVLRILGEQGAARFWDLYEEVRKELGVVDYPQTLKRFADSAEEKAVAEKAAAIINNWPYARYVYPESFAALEHLSELGDVAILSDGDGDYQPRKIANAGLTAAVGGPADVLIYTHKETCFEDVMRRIPSDHYVLIDDKEKILAGAKDFMGSRLTTVWVKQGHYANDPTQYEKPDPDITLQSIGDLRKLGKQDFERST